MYMVMIENEEPIFVEDITPLNKPCELIVKNEIINGSVYRNYYEPRKYRDEYGNEFVRENLISSKIVGHI